VTDPRLVELDGILRALRARVAEALVLEQHPGLAPEWTGRRRNRAVHRAVSDTCGSLRVWLELSGQPDGFEGLLWRLRDGEAG